MSILVGPSHNASDIYPTMHHVVTEMWSHMCTLLLRNCALWDMGVVHCGICATAMSIARGILDVPHWGVLKLICVSELVSLLSQAMMCRLFDDKPLPDPNGLLLSIDCAETNIDGIWIKQHNFFFIREDTFQNVVWKMAASFCKIWNISKTGIPFGNDWKFFERSNVCIVIKKKKWNRLYVFRTCENTHFAPNSL